MLGIRHMFQGGARQRGGVVECRVAKSVDAHAPAASEESYHLRDGKPTPDQGAQRSYYLRGVRVNTPPGKDGGK